jgi:hypothetical protein
MVLALADPLHASRSGKAAHLASPDIEAARNAEDAHIEIHDIVLIADPFCMYNRYVDRSDTWQLGDEERYRQCGRKTEDEGYLPMSREYMR